MTLPTPWLLEDSGRKLWSPFAEARPIGELLFGTQLLRERIERAVGRSVEGYVGPAWLTGFIEPSAPSVRASDAPLPAPEDGSGRLLLASRFVPDPDGSDRIRAQLIEAGDRARERPDPEALPVIARNEPEGSPVAAGWYVPAGARIPTIDNRIRLPTEALIRQRTGNDKSLLRLPGRMLAGPWELMHLNPGQLARDLARMDGGAGPDARGSGATVLGNHPVTLAGDVSLAPHVVLDAREGPIHLCDAVTIDPFTVVEGPVWVGAHSSLLGGRIARSSIGPVCKIRGEVEASVILGFSNKAHAGYLGHAVVGQWVNLGAGTTNSDLKNTYSSVRIGPENEWTVDTELLKVGVFLGDHVKTGIGTLLNTGTIVGTGTNLFGGAMPPRWIPPFSWGSGNRLVPFELDRFVEVAGTAMGRRDRELSDSMAELYTHLWERTHGGRV